MIKNKNSISPEQSMEYLQIIENSISKIFNFKNENESFSFENIHQALHFLLFNRQSDKCYSILIKKIQENIKLMFILKDLITKSDFITNLAFFWQDFSNFLDVIDALFSLLEQKYIKQNNLKSLRKIAYETFEEIFNENLKERLRKELLLNIKLENIINIIEIRKCIHILKILNIYVDLFENIFIEIKKNEFEIESIKEINKEEIVKYLEFCESKKEKEIIICDSFLEKETKEKIINLFVEIYFQNQIKTIMDFKIGYFNYFKLNLLDNFDILPYYFSLNKNSFMIFTCNLRDNFMIYLNEMLFNYNKKEDYKQLVEELKLTYEIFINYCSESEDKISRENYQELKDSFLIPFEKILNSKVEISLFLNKYIDYLLQIGFQIKCEKEIDLEIESIINLIEFLHEKDVFMNNYSKLLMKRLLTENDGKDLEYKILNSLAKKCGNWLTNRVIMMIKDWKVALELNSDYKIKINNNNSSSIDFSVKILSKGIWPIEIENITIKPKLFNKLYEEFEIFHKIKYNERNIQWIRNYNFGIIRFIINDKWTDLQISFDQMQILLLFNYSKLINFNEIIFENNINLKTLQFNLQNFEKNKILIKINETYQINLNYPFQKKFIKLNKFVKDSEIDSKTNNQIQNQRKFILETIIVRIMKTNKLISNSNLISEIRKNADSKNFCPDLPLIKSTIESLIAREFIERTDNLDYRYIN